MFNVLHNAIIMLHYYYLRLSINVKLHCKLTLERSHNKTLKVSKTTPM